MATVRMKKGDKYADIFDSPETIKQAQFDGYSLVEEKKTVAKDSANEEETPKVAEETKTTRTKRQ